MTDREKAMACIAAEVAQEGRVTRHAIRLYIETRMSPASFREAIDRGQKVADAARERGRREREAIEAINR